MHRAAACSAPASGPRHSQSLEAAPPATPPVAAMVRRYETAEEAYATRRDLWRVRQESDRLASAAAVVTPEDRYLFDLHGVRQASVSA